MIKVNNIHCLYTIEIFFTVEWERRIFKKIGEYLKAHNMTIQECFNIIDQDQSQTIDLEEMKSALIRFNLGLNDKEV